MFPAILFLLALASFFPLSNITDDVARAIGPFVSPQVLELIQDQMRRLGEGDSGGLLTFGVAGALWSSSAAMVSIVGALNKAYDIEDFVNELRAMQVTPHVAQNVSHRRSAIDGRTTRHPGYAVSQRIRKRIEEAFGWIKTIAGQEKTKFRGVDRVGFAFTFAAAAYNLVRLPKLMAQSA